MDTIELPIFPSTMALGAALDILFLMSRSALITTNGVGGLVILECPQLVRKRLFAEDPLAAVADTPPALLVPESLRRVDSRLQLFLDRGPARAGIGKIYAGKATVYTRHEDIAAAMGLPIGFCVCTGAEEEVCAPNDYPNRECSLGHPLDCRAVG